jgi:hypothetical protein
MPVLRFGCTCVHPQDQEAALGVNVTSPDLENGPTNPLSLKRTFGSTEPIRVKLYRDHAAVGTAWCMAWCTAWQSSTVQCSVLPGTAVQTLAAALLKYTSAVAVLRPGGAVHSEQHFWAVAQ